MNEIVIFLMLGDLRVHICPIGEDNPRRIYIPLLENKADKVYLITKEGEDLFKENVLHTKAEILKNTSIEESEIIICTTDVYNFYAIQSTIAKIFHLEPEAEIFFNGSTGGKLISIAGYLTCLMFQGNVYYCKKDYKNNKIEDQPEILTIPQYKLDKPEKNLIEFMFYMSQIENRFPHNLIPKRAALEIMTCVDDERFSGSSGDYNKLNSRYLDRLKDLEYIKEKIEKPRKIKLTVKGKNAIFVFNAYYHLHTEPSFEDKKAQLEEHITNLIFGSLDQ